MALRNLDWFLNASALFLFGAGLLSLASIAPEFFWAQLIWGVLGFAVIFLSANFDWRPLINYRWLVFGIYFLAVFLLIAAYFFAPVVRGTRGWLVLGPLNFQPAELAKLALIIVFSHFFAKGHIGIGQLKTIFNSFILFLVPAILVALQPDFGSALILFSIWFGFILISGIKWRHLFPAIFIFLAAFAIMWVGVFKDYQKERIVGLFNPEHDPLGINYSVIQSKIAIGSAGFFGKGFSQGTQTQLGFLPDAHTDFIYSAFIEEWGIFGGFLILAAFLLLLFRIMRLGLAADNNFGRLLALGTLVLLLAHFIFNIGSVLGLLPVVGVSFPFMSYGGSNLLINCILVGMTESIALHRRF